MHFIMTTQGRPGARLPLDAARIVAVALTYVVAAKLGLSLAPAGGPRSPLRPPPPPPPARRWRRAAGRPPPRAGRPPPPPGPPPPPPPRGIQTPPPAGAR